MYFYLKKVHSMFPVYLAVCLFLYIKQLESLFCV